MAAALTIHISEELLADLQSRAAESGKTVDELAEETLRDGIEELRWRRLLAAKREAAQKRGLSEADVSRLVQEVRAERRER